MSYHRFPNFREALGGSVDSKINAEVISMDFINCPCNCTISVRTKRVKCTYDGQCRNKCLVYKVMCNTTNKRYIGATQQNAKDRMSGHFSDVRNLVCKDVRSDSYAFHFSQFFDKYDDIPTPSKLRRMTSFKILWQGKIISLMKSFGTHNCRLCMKERLFILRTHSKDPGKLINSCNEIYGACRHKSSFHRYSENIHKERPDEHTNCEKE